MDACLAVGNVYSFSSHGKKKSFRLNLVSKYFNSSLVCKKKKKTNDEWYDHDEI